MGLESAPVATADVDAYLSGLDDPKHGTLQTLRSTILEVVPEAEQVISYRVPAFRVRGNTVAGFAAFRDHLSYLPFSGSVLSKCRCRGAAVDQSAATNTVLKVKSVSLTGLASVLPFWSTMVIASPEVSERPPPVVKALISSK